MKLTINTATLQDMVAKAMKGVSNNKVLPVTSLMSINLCDHKLTVTTTDAVNYLYIIEDKIEGEDFSVVVPADIFSKLISKLTCTSVTMELVANKLNVTGNGKYSIELPLDADGELVKYPDPVSHFSFDSTPIETNLSTIKLILNVAKSALSTEDDIPCYTGYYMGSNIVATDTFQICGIDIDMWGDTPRLLSAELVDLLNVMTSEKISVYMSDDIIIFKTDNCVVFGKTMEEIVDYQIDAINGLLAEDFNSYCSVPKDVLLQLLDRLALFVGMYDKNGIYLTFTRDGLMVTSKQNSGAETIQYSDSKNFADFTCCIDIEMFRTQVKSYAGDIVQIHYGKDNAIKLVDGNVTQLISLLDDDRMSN